MPAAAGLDRASTWPWQDLPMSQEYACQCSLTHPSMAWQERAGLWISVAGPPGAFPRMMQTSWSRTLPSESLDSLFCPSWDYDM